MCVFFLSPTQCHIGHTHQCSHTDTDYVIGTTYALTLYGNVPYTTSRRKRRRRRRRWWWRRRRSCRQQKAYRYICMTYMCVYVCMYVCMYESFHLEILQEGPNPKCRKNCKIGGCEHTEGKCPSTVMVHACAPKFNEAICYVCMCLCMLPLTEFL